MPPIDVVAPKEQPIPPPTPESRFTVMAGVPFPLGAMVVEGGVNFAVYSERAQRAFVCLFEASDPAHEV